MKKQIVTPEKWDLVNLESKKLLKEFMLTLRQEGRSKATHTSTDMTAYYKKDKGLRSLESAFGVKVGN